MGNQTPAVIQALTTSGSSHHVIVKLEAVHVDAPEVDEGFMKSRGLTYEMISYVYTPHDKDVVAQRVRDATIVITMTVPINEDLLISAPHIECVITESTGLNHIDLDACKRHGVTVLFSPNATTEAVSEHAISMYFALRRRLTVLHNMMMQFTMEQPNMWKATGSMSHLLRDAHSQPPLTCGSEVAGVIGAGPIGQRIAAICRNLGMSVMVSGRKSGPVTSQRTPFWKVISTATVLFLILPINEETKNTISAKELHMMRPEAIIVNVGRGGLVDERALLEAVRTGKVYGAGTDVFENEPAGNDQDSVLLDECVAKEGLNLVCTPHLAWFASTTRAGVKRVVEENLREYIEGGDRNVVLDCRAGKA